MKKKFLKISIVLIMFVCVYSTIASALSFTATMTPSSTTVAESTEFTVEIKVSNLDVGSNGINSLSGYLKYDSSVFETINESSIEGLNNWTPKYNSENGKITLTKTTFVKAEEKVFQITFKTKAGVSGKTGSIAYNNIMASNSAQDISAADISTNITIGTGGNTISNVPANNTTNLVPIINANPVNNTVNNNTIITPTNNTISNTPRTSYVNSTNNISKDDIPYTGVEDTIMYVIFVVLALSIVFYIKFQRIDKEMK